MKDEYFKKLALRAKQRTKLLIARPDFQEDVLAIRARFKMPSSGLTDDEINQKWHHEFYQSDDNYFETVWLKRRGEITQLKKERKLKEAEELQKQLNNEAPINAFRIAIKSLLKTYKLPLRWEESVRRYVLFNKIENMWLPVGLSIHSEHDEDTDLKKIYIEIEDDTILEDIKQQWQSVKHHQKQLHSRTKDKFQPIREFERDQLAYDLNRKGKNLKEVAKALTKEFKKQYDWYEVSKFIERHRQKIGIN
jgi:hypothetical protein